MFIDMNLFKQIFLTSLFLLFPSIQYTTQITGFIIIIIIIIIATTTSSKNSLRISIFLLTVHSSLHHGLAVQSHKNFVLGAELMSD